MVAIPNHPTMIVRGPALAVEPLDAIQEDEFGCERRALANERNSALGRIEIGAQKHGDNRDLKAQSVTDEIARELSPAVRAVGRIAANAID